jgi:hypothetical protein
LAQDLLIGDAGREFRHVENVMAVGTQSLHDSTVDTLVGDQVHADSSLTG